MNPRSASILIARIFMIPFYARFIRDYTQSSAFLRRSNLDHKILGKNSSQNKVLFLFDVVDRPFSLKKLSDRFKFLDR